MNGTIKTALLAAALCAAATAASAREGGAYAFLNIPTSARVYGLGGVNISLVDDDITLVQQNPALLGSEMGGTVALNYMHYLAGGNFAGLQYGHGAGSRGAWGASVQYLGYGSMDETLPDGTFTGTFAPKDVVASATYSHDISGGLRGGVTLKGIYSSYADFSALAMAADIGLNYYDPERDLSLSVVAVNLGGQLKRFNERHEPLGADLRLGWSQSFGSFPVRFSVTAWNLTRWKMPYRHTGDTGSAGADAEAGTVKESFGSNLFRHLVFGADLVASPNYYLSLGYNYRTRTDMSTYRRSFLSGFSLGAGIRVRSLAVGIALSQPHRSATTLMLNLSYNLNDILK